MGVNTGMLDIATNQNQLASVVGHEIGHVIANHANEHALNKKRNVTWFIGACQAPPACKPRVANN